MTKQIFVGEIKKRFEIILFHHGTVVLCFNVAIHNAIFYPSVHCIDFASKYKQIVCAVFFVKLKNTTLFKTIETPTLNNVLKEPATATNS